MNPDNNSNLNPMPVQPQQLSTINQQPTLQPPKKNNKLIVIIIILVVIGVIGAALYFANQDKKESSNNKTNTVEKEKIHNKVDNEDITDKNNKPNNGSSNNDEKETNTTHDESSTDKNNKPNSSSSNSSSSNINEEEINTTYDETGAFLFSIDDVFTITDKGTYVNGNVERGKVKNGDVVQIIGLNEEILTTEVISIERFRKPLSEAKYGETVSIWLKGIEREQVQRGQVLAKPNSINTATKFEADIHILSKEEGGINKALSNENNPQFHIRTADITGKVQLPKNMEMINPGEDASITIELNMNVAMEKGTKFNIRENGKKIGTGIVTKVY